MTADKIRCFQIISTICFTLYLKVLFDWQLQKLRCFLINFSSSIVFVSAYERVSAALFLYLQRLNVNKYNTIITQLVNWQTSKAFHSSIHISRVSFYFKSVTELQLAKHSVGTWIVPSKSLFKAEYRFRRVTLNEMSLSRLSNCG